MIPLYLTKEFLDDGFYFEDDIAFIDDEYLVADYEETFEKRKKRREEYKRNNGKSRSKRYTQDYKKRIEKDYAEYVYDETKQKRCRECQQFYPATPEYFHRSWIAKDFLSPKCKVCNREERREWQKEYNKTRNQNLSPKQKLDLSMSSAIRDTLKKKGTKKKQKWETLVGYTCEELCEHLESKFVGEMRWENYGINGWEIDHIYPKSKFVYESCDDPGFKECWALNNIQPLWCFENRRKNASISKKWGNAHLKPKYVRS